MRSFSMVSSVGFLVLLGCNGAMPAVDASVVDASVVDASVVDASAVDANAVDAIVLDTGPHDSGAPCSATNCTGAHACVRGVCIATCGAVVGTFDAALAAGLVVDGSVCRTPAALEYAGGRMYELMASTSGMITTFTLGRWTPGTESPTVETIATARYTAAAPSTMVFASGYVAVSSDEMRALFGYTTTLAGSVGGVFDVATGSGMATDVPAAGNFDASFTDATHYLVNGALGGMQGVYRGMSGGMTLSRVVSHVGDASGNVALWPAGNVVLAGGSSFGSAWRDGATMGDRVLVLDPAMLASASTPIDGSTVQQLMMPSAFELVGDRAASVHYNASFAVDAIDARVLTHTGSTVTVSAPTHLTTGATFTGVTAAGTGFVLAFANGLLFVH